MGEELTVDSEFKSLIPPLSEEEREGLEKSILAEGVRDPVVVWEGTIIDGHNRFEIATGNNQNGEIIDFQTIQKTFPDKESAKEWIVRNQLNRRNLTREQVSYFRGKSYLTTKNSHGGDRKSKPQNEDLIPVGKTSENVAKENGVSRATIERDAEYAEAVDKLVGHFGLEFRGKLLEGQSKLTKTDTLSLAKTVDKYPETARLAGEILLNGATSDLQIANLQARILFECGQNTWNVLWEQEDEEARVRASAPQLRHLLTLSKTNDDSVTADLVRSVESGECRSVFEAHELRDHQRKKAEWNHLRAEKRAERQAAPMPERKYEVILADPPWSYSFSETESRRVENQYPVMSLEEIKALEVPAEDDSVLFMWATSPKLEEALEVMEAWDYGYLTSLAWIKDRIGMGYYARQKHELVLIGKRGNPPVPKHANRPSSVFHAERKEHSAKPEILYEIIEQMYPEESKVELFARGSRKGFDTWGNEALDSSLEEVAS